MHACTHTGLPLTELFVICPKEKVFKFLRVARKFENFVSIINNAYPLNWYHKLFDLHIAIKN